MTRTRRIKYDARKTLVELGFSEIEANRLLRASNQLHTWHELECGTDRGAIERDENTGELRWYSYTTQKWGRYYGRDTETLARRMIDRVMSGHPTLGYFIQGDPRGCALYVLRPGDIPSGENVDAYYSRGIAVYKE